VWHASSFVNFGSLQKPIAMKSILVPCDFSKPAVSAFRLALDIATRSNGDIHLLHAIQLPVTNDSTLIPVLNLEADALKDLRLKAEKSFKILIDDYAEGKANISTEVYFGSVAKAVDYYTGEKQADLVIMGSHGATGARDFFIGTNAEKVVRIASIPVIVVKQYAQDPVKSIVFPTTPELESHGQLVNQVKALQQHFDAHLHLVWINTPQNFTNDTQTLKRLQSFAHKHGLKEYSLHVFNHNDEEYGILEFANMIQADMIALGTHARKGLNHLLNGSLTEDIVNHSKGLVWTCVLTNEHKNEPAAPSEIRPF
jgi:nucleotide-binding universal stress UspA family protein